MSATTDSTLANPDQRIVDLERQLVEAQRNLNETMTERDEALAREVATAEVLQVINSSPGDLQPVFEAILESANGLCEADVSTLWIYRDELFFPGAVSLRHDPAAVSTQTGWRPSPNVSLGRLLGGEDIVHVLDVTVDPGYQADAEARARTSGAGARTILSIPLRKDGYLLGAITTGRWQVRAYSDKQIALLQNVAAQAVIAMENARLITETREALEQQTATAEVLQVINSSPGDLTPVFDAMLERAMRMCGAVHGSLTSYDGEHFRCVAGHNLPKAVFEILRRPRRAATDSPQERLLHEERFVHITDTAAMPISLDNQVARALAEMSVTRTILFVPLREDGTLLGYITANRDAMRPFTDKQIAILENFAAQAVIAMENARLLGELRQRTDEVGELNRGLEARVAEQVDELGRVGRLKRFLAPQLAELIVSHGDESILESHRREIVVVFCDLRGYTAFTETAEPEEVLDFLRQYHGALGPLVSEFEGTLDQFSGDGIMVFFNDPVPCPDPAERAVKMAVAMRESAGALIADWRRRDRELGFGAGIAQGYATLGQIGFAERSGYTAIGTVCNLAARLCAEAKNGQILIAGRVAAAVEKVMVLEDLGSLALKGLTQPVSAFNVPLAATPPALRVIEGGPQSV
jgi:adenylate cyclase